MRNATHLRGANLGLLVAIAMAVSGGAWVLLGPGRGRVDAAHAALSRQLERLESWQTELARFRRPSESERARWERLWQHALARVGPAEDESALVALVSGELRSQGIRKARIEPLEAEPGSEPETHLLASPLDATSVSLVAVPLFVGFRASPDRVLRLLARLDGRALPARVRALELRRDYPEIDVEMRLDYFVRRGDGS